MKTKVLALVPARGGSKGIPRKNMAQLSGKSLLAYTINAAKDVSAISEIVVSSDDADILQEARNLKSTPLLRPSELATDIATTDTVIAHFLTREDIANEDIILLLQPTSPLRTWIDIQVA